METSKGIRCFIAIELSHEIKSALRSLQDKFKKFGADVRWVHPDNIHLTLKFLGSVNEKDTLKVINSMTDVCKKYPAFILEIKGIGIFPNINSPRVLWVGAEGDGILKGLQKDIEHGMEKIGVEQKDRKFTAHLTLGRFRSLTGKENLLKQIKLHENDSFGAIDIKSLSLMNSELHPSGSRYTRLAEVLLGQN
ncbi:MAG: RNA 2',3'-cyclic phosphodiesterase [Nitrospirae bacterium]|nr:RNA 2',3'-cyclic phosphodiesterase [Nitrospirota bacterium]